MLQSESPPIDNIRETNVLLISHVMRFKKIIFVYIMTEQKEYMPKEKISYKECVNVHFLI